MEASVHRGSPIFLVFLCQGLSYESFLPALVSESLRFHRKTCGRRRTVTELPFEFLTVRQVRFSFPTRVHVVTASFSFDARKVVDRRFFLA